MELVLTDKAYRSILDECASVRDVETGGLLIGRKINDRFIVVTFALGAGPKASHSWSRYSPDLDWQQQRLEKLHSRYGVQYVGSYHSHQGKDCLPSVWDLMAAGKIVTDPDWDTPEAIFPIINLANHRIHFYPYHFSRASMTFQAIAWHLVPHRDRLIKTILKGGWR